MDFPGISKEDTAVSRAVRLAPSSLNSQPWELKFEPGKIIVEDAGTGISRLILKNKLNKIDIGIAARHAVLALEHNGNAIISAVPKSDGSKFRIEITYKRVLFRVYPAPVSIVHLIPRGTASPYN